MKKTLRRVLSICLAILAFSGTAVGVFAQDKPVDVYADSREKLVEGIDGVLDRIFDSGESSVDVNVTGEYITGFSATSNSSFAPAEEYFSSSVAINKYKYTEGNDYIGLKMNKVSTGVYFDYNSNTKAISAFHVKYAVDAWHETPEETAFVEKYVKENLAGILGTAVTQYEKIKNIHDWIITNFDYAYSDTYNAKSHSAYGMLTNKRGVCSAYTLLFDAICRAAGFNTRIVFSEKTYAVTNGEFVLHCWNMVEVDSVWYHVDVTWDDQPQVGKGIVYNYFLKKSDYFLKYFHLWDDREDGIGTPYPTATRNHGDTPGGYDNESLTRPIEGEKPSVVKKVLGSESSVPEVVDVTEFSSEPVIASSEGEATSAGNSPIIFICAIAVFVAAVATVLFVVLHKNGKKPKQIIEETPEEETEVKEKKDESYDSYDSYDGFDN